MAAPVSSLPSTAADGPVMSLMNKRLRALRKKYNRVLQMEESVAKGKPINKEQEEVLRSKPQLTALIDEYERLRLPLSSALNEELSLHHPHADIETALEDVLKLLYFACLFDVKAQGEYETTMLMRTHERGCCITYDTVTDETTSLLEEADLDMISVLGGVMLARAPNSNVSHSSALAECVRHAKLWLRCSEEPVLPESAFSYAGLRERLNRIWASHYSMATPEIKPSIVLAAEVGKYAAGQVQGGESAGLMQAVFSEVKQLEYELKVDDLEDSENKETGTNESSQTDEPTELNDPDAQEPYKDVSTQPELDKLQVDDPEEQNYREGEPEQQQHMPRRVYTNKRALRSGGRRGYGNGRGGRGSRGGRGFQNGRSQYFDTGYYPNNYYTPRGRSGRGAGSYNHGAPDDGGHSSSVELGAS